MELNNLSEQIKKANIQAMKDKDTVARSIYSVVLNKIMLENIKKREKGEELQDSDVLVLLQKTIKELEEEKINYEKANNSEQVELIAKQIEIVKQYLPTLMSREEIKNIILGLEDKSIGGVMKHFKTNYMGKCDMRLVGEVQKEI